MHIGLHYSLVYV